MQINQLPAQTTVSDSDVFAVDNGSTTKKVTAANLGKKVTEDATPAFTSGDSSTATSWTAVNVLSSGETVKSIFNKISTMFKNIRYLFNMLGTTDISSIGGGTVTGAISALNTRIYSMRYTGTVTTGYFEVPWPSGFSATNSNVVVVPYYNNGGSGYTVVPQFLAGRIICYIRTPGPSDVPTDNTEYSIVLLFIKT